MYQLLNAIKNLKECEKSFKNDETRLKRIIKKAPHGALLIKQPIKNHSAQYEWQKYENGTRTRTYLSLPKKLRTIQKLSDKKYARIAVKAIKKALKCITVFLESCPDPCNFGVDLADKLAQKNYITTSATYLSRIEYIKQWKQSFSDFLCFHDEHKVHASEDGNVYRSKSEAMIARELQAAGIAYMYDAKKDLVDGKFAYPDFTILHPVTLQEIYWEHFGRMDKSDYANRFMEKRNEFQEAGLIEQKNLFFTFETEKYPLTQEQICRTLSEIINSHAAL